MKAIVIGKQTIYAAYDAACTAIVVLENRADDCADGEQGRKYAAELRAAAQTMRQLRPVLLDLYGQIGTNQPVAILPSAPDVSDEPMEVKEAA